MRSLQWTVGPFALGFMTLVAFQAPAFAATAAPDSVPTPAGRLTLSRALELTDRYQLALRAANLRSAGTRARVQDANRRPNPILALSDENFGAKPASGRQETTLELNQVLELGGDRKARAAAAEAEYGLATSDAAVLRREVLAATSERFIAAWALQTRTDRLREGEGLAREAVIAATERHRAGASLILERTRAESQALSQAVERQRTEAELAIARRNLAAQWGATEASFDSLILPVPAPSRDIPDSERDVAEHPEMNRASANQALADARVRTAEASRVPDLTVSAGVRRLKEVNATGFVAGVEIPLPLWNRGTGSLTAAQRDREAADADARAAAQRLRVAVANAVERLQSAGAVYDTLRIRVRPTREQLVHDLLSAYRAGRLNYLDLVAEQRNLLDTDLALVEAQADVWRARVALDLVVGGGVLPVGQGKEER